MIHDLELSKGASSIAIDSKNSFLEKKPCPRQWTDIKTEAAAHKLSIAAFPTFQIIASEHRQASHDDQTPIPSFSLSYQPLQLQSDPSNPTANCKLSRETSTFSSDLTTMQLATQHEIDMAYIVFMMTVVVSIISIRGFNLLKSGNVYGRTCNCSATELVGRRVTR